MDALWKYFKNDHFAERCGIELLEISPGYARARMPLREDHWNGLGFVQGGAIFTSPISPLPPHPIRMAPWPSASLSITSRKPPRRASDPEAKDGLAQYNWALTCGSQRRQGDLVASFQWMVTERKSDPNFNTLSRMGARPLP